MSIFVIRKQTFSFQIIFEIDDYAKKWRKAANKSLK